MNKLVLVLDGIQEGKLKFIETIHNEGYRFRSIDTSNIDNFINKFFIDEFIDILILNNCCLEKLTDLQSNCRNFYSIFIGDGMFPEDNYDYVLNYKESRFNLATLNIINKFFNKEIKIEKY